MKVVSVSLVYYLKRWDIVAKLLWGLLSHTQDFFFFFPSLPGKTMHHNIHILFIFSWFLGGGGGGELLQAAEKRSRVTNHFPLRLCLVYVRHSVVS